MHVYIYLCLGILFLVQFGFYHYRGLLIVSLMDRIIELRMDNAYLREELHSLRLLHGASFDVDGGGVVDEC